MLAAHAPDKETQDVEIRGWISARKKRGERGGGNEREKEREREREKEREIDRGVEERRGNTAQNSPLSQLIPPSFVSTVQVKKRCACLS